MKGFKAWYKRVVIHKYADRSYKELKHVYYSEYINTGSIELPGYMTKSGNPELWYR